jgi:serine/threonine protein kinase
VSAPDDPTTATTVKRCPQCDTEYDSTQRYCSVDGAVLRGSGDDVQLEGSIIGGREIVRRLGEGGMGQVYLGRSVRTGRLDAVKVMRPDFAQSADAVSRFNREAMNAVRIQHPNVAIVYDVGDTDAGTPWLAMEFVDGESLAELLKRTSTLPLARAAEIVRQIAAALQAAHGLGIVHRDLKPENVMIARADTDDVVKLVDFGISKVAGSADQQLTATGIVVGSPAYMSPEQVLGGGEITAQSDIYSLALVAFRMLAGRIPFDGDIGEVMMARVVREPLALRDARPGGPWSDELERVIARGLARNPVERFARAAEFAREFAAAARACDAEDATVAFVPPPAPALPASSSGQLPTWWKRPGVIAASVGVASLGVVLVTLAMKGPASPNSGTDSPTAGSPSASPVTARTDSAGGPSKGPGNRTIRVAFNSPRLRVGVTGLSPAARATVDSAARAAVGVTVTVPPPGATTDVDLSSEGDGRIGIRGAGLDRRVHAGADSVLAFFRYLIASRDLSGLTIGAAPGDLTFEFDRATADMRVGDSFRFRMRSMRGGYLTVVDIAPSGNLTVLIPNSGVTDVRRLAPAAATVVPELTKEAIATGPPAGPGQLWAIVTERPLATPPTVSKDGAKAAAQLRRELERLVRFGDSPWSVVVLPYELKPRR